MTMAGPDVLGIPAPAGVLTGLSVAANTILATSIILTLGLVILMIILRSYGKRLEFLAPLKRDIKGTFLPTLTIALTSIFMSLLFTYLSGGHSLFFAENNLVEDSGHFFPLLYMVRIVFLAAISLSAAGVFITLFNHVRTADERIAIFGFRIVCGATFAAFCARIADIWLTATNHPANPELAVIIIVGSIIAAATIGSSILGILRPRLPLWSIATASAILVGIAASSYINIYFADEAYRAAAPTFGAAYRIQPILMSLFFVCTGIGLGAIALTMKWWLSDLIQDQELDP